MDQQPSELTPREIIYYGFYLICFCLSIYWGIITGFTGTHTMPLPFAVQVFCLPIGLILFLIDVRMWNSTKVHKIGLTANGLIMAYVLVLAFV